MIQGQGAYSRLKYESGVHRVQRVPETESGGRIHTSTCTVAIMPEAEEIDFHLDMNDCKFDVGSEHPETVDSASIQQTLQYVLHISRQESLFPARMKNHSSRIKIRH